MIKDAFNRFFFRGRAARETIRTITKRLDLLERSMSKFMSGKERLSEGNSKITTPNELSQAIRKVITALETEREFIRTLQSQMLDLELSHRDGTHRDIYLEIDALRAMCQASLAEEGDKICSGGDR